MLEPKKTGYRVRLLSMWLASSMKLFMKSKEEMIIYMDLALFSDKIS
jgi:hypothetical protein